MPPQVRQSPGFCSCSCCFLNLFIIRKKIEKTKIINNQKYKRATTRDLWDVIKIHLFYSSVWLHKDKIHLYFPQNLEKIFIYLVMSTLWFLLLSLKGDFWKIKILILSTYNSSNFNFISSAFCTLLK